MLAYFFGTTLRRYRRSEYEKALLGFHADLMAYPPAGIEGSATYQISKCPG